MQEASAAAYYDEDEKILPVSVMRSRGATGAASILCPMKSASGAQRHIESRGSERQPCSSRCSLPCCGAPIVELYGRNGYRYLLLDLTLPIANVEQHIHLVL